MGIQQMLMGGGAGGLNPDANGDYLVLAMPLNSDYGDADVSNEINSGSTTKTITTNGNAAASNTQYKFYDSSYYFDGTGDYLTVADNADFEFDGDFTLECFVYLTSTSGGQVFIAKRATSGHYGPFHLYTNSGATILQFVGSTNGSSWALDLNGSASYPIPINTWTHIAAARSGSTLKIFVLHRKIQVGMHMFTTTKSLKTRMRGVTFLTFDLCFPSQNERLHTYPTKTTFLCEECIQNAVL